MQPREREKTRRARCERTHRAPVAAATARTPKPRPSLFRLPGSVEELHKHMELAGLPTTDKHLDDLFAAVWLALGQHRMRQAFPPEVRKELRQIKRAVDALPDNMLRVFLTFYLAEVDGTNTDTAGDKVEAQEAAVQRAIARFRASYNMHAQRHGGTGQRGRPASARELADKLDATVEALVDPPNEWDRGKAVTLLTDFASFQLDGLPSAESLRAYMRSEVPGRRGERKQGQKR